MARRIAFDRIAFDLPNGFTPSEGGGCFIFSRSNPYASATLHNCGYYPGDVDIPEIRIHNGGPRNVAKQTHHVDDLFPGVKTREYYRAEEPDGLKPGNYDLMVDIPDFCGLHLFLEFVGIGDNRFPEDLSIWRAFLTSMAEATKSDRKHLGMLADYEVKLKQFAKWGKKTPEWPGSPKSRIFPVQYPNGEPADHDRKIVGAFLEKEPEIADAIARLVTQAFIARELPFLRELDCLYEELGLNLEMPKDASDHMLLISIEVMQKDDHEDGQLRLHFAADWHANGQCILVDDLDAKDSPVKVAFSNW